MHIAHSNERKIIFFGCWLSLEKSLFITTPSVSSSGNGTYCSIYKYDIMITMFDVNDFRGKWNRKLNCVPKKHTMERL